jgi:hypothetical protein
MTRKQLGYVRYGLEKALAEVNLQYSGFDKFDTANSQSAARMKAHMRELQKPAADAPRLTIAAE